MCKIKIWICCLELEARSILIALFSRDEKVLTRNYIFMYQPLIIYEFCLHALSLVTRFHKSNKILSSISIKLEAGPFYCGDESCQKPSRCVVNPLVCGNLSVTKIFYFSFDRDLSFNWSHVPCWELSIIYGLTVLNTRCIGSSLPRPADRW